MEKIEKSLAEIEKRQLIELENTEFLFNNDHLLFRMYGVKNFEQLRDLLIGDND